MAVVNQNTPFGLTPVQRFDGAAWRNSLRRYYVPAANTNALFVGDPVTKVAASADINGVNGIDLTSNTGAITGVICGWAGVCAAGTGNPAFFGLSGTPGNIYRPASTSMDYYALVNDDPEAEFWIQENDDYSTTTANPTPVAAVGKNANIIHAAGSIYTGLSGTMLDASTIATTATLQLSIKGFVASPAAVPAALYGKLVVTINNHTETPHQAGI